MKALRYALLEREIEKIGAKRILEVGTCRGERAEMMIRAALIQNEDVYYFGFDLFEAPPDYELSGRKAPDTYEQVTRRLSGLGAYVSLVRGDTRQTLAVCPVTNIDLAFIDGGHSDETVRSDFENVVKMVRPGASIFLDDYWTYHEGGCNALVDSLDRERFDVTLLEPADLFAKPYGSLKINMVKVLVRQ